MKLTFWGAARTVTGSMHLLALNGKQYLLDCGLYQGHRKEARERNATCPSRELIDAVLVSHAHIDHTGNLPTLVRTASGADHRLAGHYRPLRIHARDSAHLQEKDARVHDQAQSSPPFPR